jgi:hypothetical protein
MHLIDESGERGIGFPFKGGCDDVFHASFACALHGKLRVGTVTGDEEERFGFLHRKRGIIPNPNGN